MCGVIYAKNFEGKNVNSLVKDTFILQRSRGIRGFGFVEILDDKIITKRFTKEDDALEQLQESNASEILFHHRTPTSTDNTIKTNHPIEADNDVYKHNYYFIHNGVIGNCWHLKSEHEKFNIKYTTQEGYKFNDSEALMHELIFVIEGIKKPEKFEAQGSLAFVMIQTDKNNVPLALYYGRNNANPLKLTELAGLMTLRSEGGGDNVEHNKLFRFDYKTKETTVQDLDLGSYSYSPTRYVSSVSHTKEVADIISDLYENKFLVLSSIKGLHKDELNLLLVIGRRVRNRVQSQYEKMMENSDGIQRVMLKVDLERCMNNLKKINEAINT